MAAQTMAESYATKYAATMVEGVLSTIKWVRVACTSIMLIAMITSYAHQREFLASLGTPVLGAFLIPISLDAFTFLCVKILGTRGMAQSARRTALVMLVFPVLVSGAVNFLAPGDIITKGIYLVAVLMIPAAEYAGSKVKPDFTIMGAMEAEVVPVAGDQAQTETPAHPLKGRKLTDEEKQARREARDRNALSKLNPQQKRALTMASRRRELATA